MTLRVAVFGDSIANGLGARGRPYPAIVCETLGARLLDGTGSAKTVRASVGEAASMRGCDIAIVAHGITEALPRPDATALRLVPPRWRRPGWLDPRPYYASGALRGTVQRAESAVRWRVKVALMRWRPPAAWMSADEYGADLGSLIEDVAASTTLVLGGTQIDERYFPGSQAALDAFSAIARDVAADTGVVYVDTAGVCRRWDDYLADHFHPTPHGHVLLAHRLLEALDSAGVATPH